VRVCDVSTRVRYSECVCVLPKCLLVYPFSDDCLPISNVRFVMQKLEFCTCVLLRYIIIIITS